MLVSFSTVKLPAVSFGLVLLTAAVVVAQCAPPPGAAYYLDGELLRGDVNNNGVINITDMTYLSNWKFLGSGPPPPCNRDAADFNDDASVDITDVIGIGDFLFESGPPPAAPYPAPACECTPDDVDTVSSPPLTGGIAISSDVPLVFPSFPAAGFNTNNATVNAAPNNRLVGLNSTHDTTGQSCNDSAIRRQTDWEITWFVGTGSDTLGITPRGSKKCQRLKAEIASFYSFSAGGFTCCNEFTKNELKVLRPSTNSVVDVFLADGQGGQEFAVITSREGDQISDVRYEAVGPVNQLCHTEEEFGSAPPWIGQPLNSYFTTDFNAAADTDRFFVTRIVYGGSARLRFEWRALFEDLSELDQIVEADLFPPLPPFSEDLQTLEYEFCP